MTADVYSPGLLATVVPMNERRANYQRHFRGLEQRALDALEAGDHSLALSLVRDAANWAWNHHPSQFASAPCESVLTQVGRAHDRSQPRRHTATPERVLHVMTEAYGIGGHTRITTSWMQLDDTREHSVVLTGQETAPIPETLLVASQNQLRDLTGLSDLERLEALSALVSEVDLVILNIHPHDAIAVAACAGARHRARTFFINHADHLLWLGVSAADHILDLRPSAVPVTRTRRCSTDNAATLFPLPLDEPVRDPARGAALAHELGIPSGAPVSASLAEPYKFTDDTGSRFVDLLRTLLRQESSLHHIAVGPGPTTPLWRELSEEFPTRVHLRGITRDYAAVFDAATFFLDSSPFSSITAALEAAAWGLPVLSFVGESVTPLAFDDLGVRPVQARNADSWLRTARTWCREPHLARSAGTTMRLDCLAIHSPTKWVQRLERLLLTPWTLERSREIPAPVAPDAFDDAVDQLARTRQAMAERAARGD